MPYLRYATDDHGMVVTGAYNSDGELVDYTKVLPPEGDYTYFTNVKRTRFIHEAVALAAKYANVDVVYIDRAGMFEEMDHSDAAEAYENGYSPERISKHSGSLWKKDNKDKTEFFKQLHHLEKSITKILYEPEVPNDYLLFGGYLYVMDGEVQECLHFSGNNNSGIRVDDYKSAYRVSEIRQCDNVGRQQRLPLREERSSFDRNFRTQMGDDAHIVGMVVKLSGTHPGKITQRHRRPRTSNKIKKVK